MSSKAIYEGDGKRLLSKNLKNEHLVHSQFVHIDEDTDLDGLVSENPWLNEKVCSFCLLVYEISC